MLYQQRAVNVNNIKECEDMTELFMLIAGSRDFGNYAEMEKVCDKIIADKQPSSITIISGGARGADKLAELYAQKKNYKIKIFPAKWNIYGRSAGYKRNEEMQQFLAQQINRCVVCFWDGSSPGTAHNFPLAKKLNNELFVYNYKLNTNKNIPPLL